MNLGEELEKEREKIDTQYTLDQVFQEEESEIIQSGYLSGIFKVNP